MAKVLTMGENMLRLKTKGNERFFQSPEFEATFGGGEANVAVSLANFNMPSEFLRFVPKGGTFPTETIKLVVRSSCL